MDKVDFYIYIAIAAVGFGLFVLVRGGEGCDCSKRSADWVMTSRDSNVAVVTGWKLIGGYRIDKDISVRGVDDWKRECTYTFDNFSGFGDFQAGDTVAVIVEAWTDKTDGDWDYDITNVTLLGRKYGN